MTHEAQGWHAVDTVMIHGHRCAYVKTGHGPALLLLHGLGCDHHTWDKVLPLLRRHFTVIAPDLFGHGQSDKPRGDYSVAGYANIMRDLVTLLDIDRVTIVGHSLGGGVAMQFAYQYPERTERLVLLAPGGMGAEVSLLLRALTLPGAGVVLDAITPWPVRRVGRSTLRALGGSGLGWLRDAGELADAYERMADPATRTALRHVARELVDWRGQVVTMTDRAYLFQDLPMCVIWGADDAIIPARHAEIARRYAPAADIVVLHDSGHFPHHDHPAQVVQILRDFVARTRPAVYPRGHWGAVLRSGSTEPRHQAVESA
jgi:pimeloyl-ACP methyl ester carboxylesterase